MLDSLRLSRGGCQSLSQKKIQPFQVRPFHQCHAILACLEVGLLKFSLSWYVSVQSMAVVVTGLKRLGLFLHLNDFVTGLWQLLVVNKTPFGAYGTSGADLTLLQIYGTPI